VLIDAENFVEINQPASPRAGPPGRRQASATTLGVTTDANMPSQGGRFYSAYPLYDGTNRMLVSWSPCLVLDTTVTPAPPNVCTPSQYQRRERGSGAAAVHAVDLRLRPGTLSPVLSAEAGTMVVEPVIMQARTPTPTILTDGSTIPTIRAANMVNNSVGFLNIRASMTSTASTPPNPNLDRDDRESHA
jgi:hypothetical protein